MTSEIPLETRTSGPSFTGAYEISRSGEHTHRWIKPDYISTASTTGMATIISCILGGEFRMAAIDFMFSTIKRQNSKPEIMLVKGMDKEAPYIKQSLREKGYGGEYCFHLPKFDGIGLRDYAVAFDAVIRRDKTGVLFYTHTRKAISPISPTEYKDFMAKIFTEHDGFSPKDCQVLTVHDATIIDREKSGLNHFELNETGELIAEYAKKGYPIGVELVIEGPNLSLGCSYTSYIESFILFCKENNFGLTLDTFNIMQIVARSGGTLEDFPNFFANVILLARKHEVGVRMVHFNPFNISLDSAHLDPSLSSISYPWLKSFLKQFGLPNVPISLETYKGFLTDDIDLTPTKEQQETEAILFARTRTHYRLAEPKDLLKK
jgi:hypothetical protein